MSKASGKITHISEVQTFEKGAQKVQFVIETDEKDWQGHKKIMAFDFFAGKAKLEKMDNFQKYQKVGQFVDVDYDIDCREYNGKYYTNLSAWKVIADKDMADNTIAVGADEILDEDPPF
ncbi:MAG: DUF3127 domain-containing protein [Phaeodactylibacter sp.]|nr:DUF3127 domain-containing protein [Phaeodactylibacter sp.]